MKNNRKVKLPLKIGLNEYFCLEFYNLKIGKKYYQTGYWNPTYQDPNDQYRTDDHFTIKKANEQLLKMLLKNI